MACLLKGEHGQDLDAFDSGHFPGSESDVGSPGWLFTFVSSLKTKLAKRPGGGDPELFDGSGVAGLQHIAEMVWASCFLGQHCQPRTFMTKQGAMQNPNV